CRCFAPRRAGRPPTCSRTCGRPGGSARRSGSTGSRRSCGARA
ncbi:MAG: hypothetical protein AVDCRST_MAG85-419, partial [uncultured Solirubrobacteraceae bacterium]